MIFEFKYKFRTQNIYIIGTMICDDWNKEYININLVVNFIVKIEAIMIILPFFFFFSH